MNKSVSIILLIVFSSASIVIGQSNVLELDGKLRINSVEASASDSLLVWRSDSTIGFKLLAPATPPALPGIDSFMISNNTLFISLVGDNVSAKSVDLSSFNNTMALRDSMVSVRSSGYLTSFVEQDGDVTNELQHLDTFQLVGNELRISMVNDQRKYQSIDLSKFDNLSALGDSMIQIRSIGYLTSFQEQDGDITNELQRHDTFELVNHELRISLLNDGVGIHTVNLSQYNDLPALQDSMSSVRAALQDSMSSVRAAGYLTSFVEQDGDVMNEIQQLDTFRILNNVLQISLLQDGVAASTVDLTYYDDKQELRDSIAQIRASGYISSAAGLDVSTTNEIQMISLVEDSLILSLEGGSVRIDTSSTNELQSLSDVLSRGNSANMTSITDLLDPFNSQDAATKYYVDQTEKKLLDILFRLETSLGIDSISDIEGNYYKIGKIGSTYWMLENLRTRKYQDGTMIDSISDGTTWGTTTNGAWTYYNLDPSVNDTTGKLYNFHAVANSRGLCPAGWEVASDFNWTELVQFLDPAMIDPDTIGVQSLVAGGFLKSTDTRDTLLMTGTGWIIPNTSASNSVNFSAEPGGSRDSSGLFQSDLWFFGYWWTSSQSSSTNAFYRKIGFDSGEIIRGSSDNLQPGYSVRCVRN